MDTSLLSSILSSIGSIATWVGVLSGGTVLTYYVLPHISGRIHANAITFIWVSGLLAAWAFVIQPFYIDPLVSMFRYFLNLIIYPLSPYPMLQSFLDTFYSLLAAWTIKIAFFPDQHHARL